MAKKIPAWRLPPLPGETPEQTAERRDRQYFKDQRASYEQWFQRMGGAGGPIEFAGKRVLEIGCGHGALAIYAAQHGAAEVVGIDVDDSRIAFARRQVEEEFPDCRGIARFECIDLALFDAPPFDLVISKDSFEHIEDLPAMLGHIRRLLRPGGALAVGFSPLYYSPWGDHARFRLKVPWLHAVLPEPVLARWATRRLRKPVSSAMDLGLNRLTPAEFRDLMGSLGWADLSIRYNQGDKRLFKLFDVLRQVPGCERFFTVNIYAVATMP